MSITDQVEKKQKDWQQRKAMMKQSLLQKDEGKESAHIFDVEIKKMPEDTHNKVVRMSDYSCTSLGSLTSATQSRWDTGHTT